MDPEELTPRPPSKRDIAALIGLLAVVQGELTASESPSETAEWAARLVKRLHRDGLLPATPGGQEVRQVLNDLNQRLRYALGEYDSLPSPSPVP